MQKREIDRCKTWKRKCRRAAMALLAAGVAFLSPAGFDDEAGLAVAEDLIVQGGGGGGGGGSGSGTGGSGGGGGGGGGYVQYDGEQYFIGGGSGGSGGSGSSSGGGSHGPGGGGSSGSNGSSGGDGGVGGGGGGSGGGSGGGGGGGGSGGSGGSGGDGGAAGDFSGGTPSVSGAEPTGDTTVPSSDTKDGVTISVSKGGNGGDRSGGEGGDASFTAEYGITLTGDLSVQSGSGGNNCTGTGTGNGGSGGDATFDVDRLVAAGDGTQSFTFATGADNGNPNRAGDVWVSIGDLRLENDVEITLDQRESNANFDVSIGDLFFVFGKTLSITGTGKETFTNFGGTLSVFGSGNTMTASETGTIGYDATALSFVLTESMTDGDVMLDSSDIAINVDNNTTLSLSGSSTLDQGETVTLATNVTGSLDSTVLETEYVVGRQTFAISLESNALTATVSAFQSSFVEAQSAALPASRINANMERGAGHLNWLETRLGTADPLMVRLDNLFSVSTDAALGDWGNRVALGQMYGEYGAYANTALVGEFAAFRNRWQARNNAFLDSGLFSDQLAHAPGIGSGAALASPRDRIARGKSRVWGGGFGAWAKQDGRDGNAGYKYDSQGGALGWEYTLDSLNLGFAASYSRGELAIGDLNYKNETDALNLALYGTYLHQSGFYLKGGLGYSHVWNDYRVHTVAVAGGVKEKRYGSDAFGADLELGRLIQLPRDFTLVPSLGVEYVHLRNDSWTENVNNALLVANRFDSGSQDGVDVPLGLRVNRLFRFGCDGGFVVPEVRGAFVYAAGKARSAVTVGYAGSPGGATMYGVDPGRTRWRVGGGVSGRVNDRVDFRVEYDFETGSGFRSHNLNAMLGLSF